MLRVPILLVAALTLAVPGCRRFQTTDELRAKIRGESERTPSWFDAPCQEVVADTFGWRPDTLGRVSFRLPSVVRVRGARDFRERSYQYNRGSLYLLLTPDAGDVFRRYSLGSDRWRHGVCSIGSRPAEVANAMEGTEYVTAVRWMEADGNLVLVAIARGRLLEEVQMMRAVLFTMRFP
jgi:hypothetical protein